MMRSDKHALELLLMYAEVLYGVASLAMAANLLTIAYSATDGIYCVYRAPLDPVVGMLTATLAAASLFGAFTLRSKSHRRWLGQVPLVLVIIAVAVAWMMPSTSVI
jgi:hypothetical protein